MRIWITGIAGFLGSHLADALIANNHEVHGNDNLICGSKSNVPQKAFFAKHKTDSSFIDCSDHRLMHQCLELTNPDVLIHCAATAHEGLSNFSPSFITRNIYEASVATFSAAIASGVKRIVYMSSMARYGAQEPPFTEDLRPQPIDPYGIAKVAAEETLKALCRVHNVKWTIAVPHNIIGIRQRSCDPYRNVAAIMINRCKQGKPPIIYGDGSQKRCFSPIADCIPSLIKMVEGETDGQIVNIGPDDGEITIKTLAEKIIHFTGFNNSHFTGNPIYLPARPNEVKEAYCSSNKACRLLNYEPKQSIDDCLKEMVDYIKPAPFVYDFPIEILADNIPKTWSERLM